MTNKIINLNNFIMDTLYLTLDELLKFNFKSACGIYDFKPSLSYIISTHYKNINIIQNNDSITVEGELHKKVLDFYNEQCGLSKSGNQIIFSFDDEIKLKSKINNFRFSNLKNSLPKPKNNTLSFNINFSLDLDLDLEITRLKQSIKRFFPDNPFTINYTTKYHFDFVQFYSLDFKIDEDLFWKKMFSEVHGEIFKISNKLKKVAFDFKNRNEYINKLDILNHIPEISIYNRNLEQKFKVYELEKEYVTD